MWTISSARSFPRFGAGPWWPPPNSCVNGGDDLLGRVAHWSALPEEEVDTLLAKLEDRAAVLGLQFRRREWNAKLMDLTALATSLALDFAYTGAITG